MNADEISQRGVEVLNANNIPYMLVGSLSTNFHSIARSTKDADIVVQSSLSGAAKLIAAELDFLKLDPQYGFESVTATKSSFFDQ